MVQRLRLGALRRDAETYMLRALGDLASGCRQRRRLAGP